MTIMIAILIVASATLGFVVIGVGFVVDYSKKLDLAIRLDRLTRQEVAAYKTEILHHINHLTVRKRPAERAKEQGAVITEGPAARARRQRGD